MSLPERRADIGSKIQYTILTLIITGLISIFVIGAFTRAEQAKEIGTSALAKTALNEERISQMKENISDIKSDQVIIRIDVKDIKESLIKLTK